MIEHHPSDELLHRFSNGGLDLGRHTVVAAHTEMCNSCQRISRALDEISGQQLVEMPAVPMNRFPEMPEKDDPIEKFAAEPSVKIPVKLSSVDEWQLQSWRWIGPGLRKMSTSIPQEDGYRVFLLKAKPGTQLPQHTHTGTELTLVLKGSFSHKYGHYRPGDFEEANESVIHRPAVDSSEECICLVAMDCDLLLPGMLGRLLGRFVRL